MEDGLTQGTINAIQQDSNGFIWFATESGIDIFDGYNFKPLDLPGDSSIETAYELFLDSNKNIWIITTSGLIKYDHNSKTLEPVIKSDPESEDFYIVNVTEQDNDTFWVATSKTVLRYTPSTKNVFREVDLSGVLGETSNIFAILSKDNHLFIGTRSGLFVYEKKTKELIKVPNIVTGNTIANSDFDNSESGKIYDIHIDNKNTLYLGTNDGLFSIEIDSIKSFIADRETSLTYQLLIEEVSTWEILQIEESIYVASNIGLSKINLDSLQPEFLFGLSDGDSETVEDKIISLAVDKNEKLWLGSSATGAYLWDSNRSQITNYGYSKKHKHLSHNEVWDIHLQKSNPNVVWVATRNGLSNLDKNTKSFEHFLVSDDTKSEATSSHIFKIFEDNNERLWLSTAKGVTLFDLNKKALIPLPFDEQTNKLLSKGYLEIYLNDKNILSGVSEDRFFSLDIDSGQIESYSEFEQLVPPKTIFTIFGSIPETQELLISTNQTIWSLNLESKEVKKIYTQQGISSSEWTYVDSWAVDKNNIIWVAFAGKNLLGLSGEDYEVKHVFDRQNSTIDLNIYGLQNDSDGDIWFSSHDGVYYLNSDTLHIRNFSAKDGFASTEFNSGAYTRSDDGIMYYGAMKGISIFTPKILKNTISSEKPKVHLTHINVLSRELDSPIFIDEKSVQQLSYDDVGIRFDFSTFDFLGGKNTQYEFILTGDKTVQYPLTKDNFITFAQLNSGNHTLMVRALSPETGLYSDQLSISIKVSYAPWASPAAYFAYLLVTGVLCAYIYLRRRKQRLLLLEAHEEVKFRENRLQLALTGSNSEVWDWQAKENLMFGKRVAQELGYIDLATSHSFSEHVELIHPEDKESFVNSWKRFISEGSLDTNFSCTYRMKTADGKWLWYKDLGKVVSVDKEGLPSRVTGSYMNITKTKADEERAQYYGEAFKQTTDWVLIINEGFTHVTANKSFREVFGWEEGQHQFSSDLLGLNKGRWFYYRKLLPSMGDGEHWRGEELIQTENGKEYHVLVNINVTTNVSNNRIYMCVFTDITAQKTAEKELRYMANYDHLTDLPNRSLLLERIKHAIDRAKRKKSSIALFFIDLDRFKQVNDSLGHDNGDLLLIEVTRRLTEVLRGDDTIARIGGDEFVVLLESFKNNSHLGKIAQKIIEAVEQPVELKDNDVSVGASIGIAMFPEDSSNSSELLKNADVAMYHAKQIGRNTFQFFTPRMNFEAEHRLKQESNIKQAHANNEFINYYQPIINANIGKAIGVELLLRWQSIDGILTPNHFISIAEELGIIIQMTESAIERGLQDLVEWRQERPEFYLSVNLSALHFVDSNLVDKVRNFLEKYQLPPNSLKFEITESALISEPEKVIRIMNGLNNIGVKLALDDFGTGFSSLSYLRQLPLDIIKIDRSFVSGIGREKADEAIVDTTLVLAKQLNMRCIAEGVETKEQLAYLVERQCPLIQGYLYSKPVDKKTITRYLKEDNTELSMNA